MQKESATVLGIGFYPTETMRPMPYSTGLTDSQWEAIKPYLDRQRKRRYDLRHIVVDTMGLLMAVVVHAANVHESRGAPPVLAKLQAMCPRLQRIWADSAYIGELAETVHRLRD